MFGVQRKNKIKRILQSPLSLILLCIILVVFAKAAWRVYDKESLSRDNLERQKAELAKLSLREKDLQESIDFLKTEEGVESEIRSKFRLAKDGESIAVIVDDDASNTPKNLFREEKDVASSTSGFWQKLIKWFEK